ncbi:MAG: S-layer homology domain-containing protein [Gudongella sp.]|nr:S-layer homology domain-containing protein [Gudongella sp.]
MNKKILSLFLTLIMVLGSFSTVFAAPYDVVGTTFEDAVVRLQGLEVLIGYPDGSFKPSNNITRAEYSAVVARIKGLEQAASSSMGSTIFGDVPANFWASGYINESVQAGLIKGMGIYNGINTFGPQLNITYEQAVTLVVRALGYEAEAEANGGYPMGHLMIAAREGLLQDVNGTLGTLATRGLVAQLTYNALNIPLMGNSGEYLFNELRMINEAAASGNWGTINAATFTAAGITGVTASNIGNLKSTLESLASGTNQNWSPSAIQGVFDTLVVGKKVISAKATSATKVEIEFNTKLDATDAITILPYKLSISGVTFVGVPELSADAKTLMFTASAPIDVNNAALVVEPIQTEENPTVMTDRYTSSFTYKDTVKPELDAIVSKTNSSIATDVMLQFSEPIQAIATVKIDGIVEIPVGFIAGADSANFVGLSLSASGTHTVQIVGLTDEQNNTTSLINKTFTVEVDNVLPKVSLSTSNDRDNVIIAEFDKPVTIVSATAALVNGIVKDESLANIASLTAVPMDPAAGFATKFEIEVVAPFALLTTRNLTVLIPVGISDSVGNTVATTTKTVTLVKDTTDPKIEAVGAMKDPSDKVMALVLSIDSTLDTKLMVPAVPLNSDITVIDPNGVLLDSSTWLGGLSQNLITAGDNKITMTFAVPATLSGEYTITFDAGLAMDQADMPNNLKSKTVTIDFGTAPSTGTFSLVPADVTSGGTNIFVVDFGDPVKGGNVAGSATALANYSLNGTSLPVGTTITLNVAKDKATITLPAESIAMTDTGALFTIDDVMKLSGETIDAFVTTIGVVDNVKPVMNSAVLKNDNTLVVGISEGISTALPNVADFVIKINGKVLNTTPAFTAGIGSDAGKFILDLEPLVLNDLTQTYINLDGVIGYNAANDVFVKTEAVQTAFTMLTSPVVSSLTIEVVGATTTDNATPANGLKLGTIISAK